MDSLALARHKARRLQDRVMQARQDGGTHAAALVLARMLRQAGMRVIVTTADVITDRRYGMRTAGVVRNERTLRDRSEHADANHYQPISRRGFGQVLAAADVIPALTSFVDLGAGRGRALVFAAEHGFRTVLGVELDPALAEQARSNVAGWQSRRGRRVAVPVTFEVRTGDAAAVELPPGAVVVFVYNSFGPETLRAVLRRIVASHDANPRPISVCYFNPVHADVVESSPRLRMTARTPYWLVCTVA